MLTVVLAQVEITDCDLEAVKRPQIDALLLNRLAAWHTAEAKRVVGLVSVKCHIAEDGSISKCHALTSLPPSTEALLTQQLEALTATPAAYRGKPLAVEWVFNFKLSQAGASVEGPPR